MRVEANREKPGIGLVGYGEVGKILPGAPGERGVGWRDYAYRIRMGERPPKERGRAGTQWVARAAKAGKIRGLFSNQARHP